LHFLSSFRRIEYDLRSPANTTQGNPLHARSPELRHKQLRQDSISSDLSNLTIDSEGNLENEWAIWNKIINNWPVYIKKKPQWIRVIINLSTRIIENVLY
jgi:hypothetical protein